MNGVFTILLLDYGNAAIMTSHIYSFCHGGVKEYKNEITLFHTFIINPHFDPTFKLTKS